jgi:hypothetical protein
MDEIAPKYDVIVLGTGTFAAPHSITMMNDARLLAILTLDRLD